VKKQVKNNKQVTWASNTTYGAFTLDVKVSVKMKI
jgi:hypothetical protein